MTTNHTPTPWRAYFGEQPVRICSFETEQFSGRQVGEFVADALRPEDAEHIVRCVNAWDSHALLRLVVGRLIENGSIAKGELPALLDALQRANQDAGVSPDRCTATKVKAKNV